MPLDFDVQLNSDDMYRFNLYHAYTSAQGIMSLLVGIFIIVVIAISDSLRSLTTGGPYFLIALVFMFYVPITLRIRSKRQLVMSDVLAGVLHFSLTEEGLTVSSAAAEDSATLPWNYIYKVVTTKHNLLIYSNRVNAYVIPKAQVKDQLNQIYDICESQLEDYKLHIKRD